MKNFIFADFGYLNLYMVHVRWQCMMQERDRVIIESDEDIDGGFSCLLDEKGTGSWSN